MPGPYDDDELSDADKAILAAQDEADRQITAAPDGKVPGILEGDSDSNNAELIAEAEATAAAAAAAAKKPDAAAPAAPAVAPEAPADAPAGETLAQFIARHADKPPEELAALVENRGKRLSREQFQRRQSGRTPEQMQAARNALQQRRQSITGTKDTLAKTIEEDPDAATRLLAERAVDADLAEVERAERALDAEEHAARLDNAIDFAAKYVPDFGQVFPQMREFGSALGYTPEELDGISDGRDLVVLNLARIAGNLIQSKVIDVRGNMLPRANPVDPAPKDPRLTAPAPPSTHSGPSNAAAPQLTIEQQISGALSMSDADFAKLSDAELARLMGA